MTLDISANRWAKPALVLGGLLVIAGLWSYLASGFAVMAFGGKFDQASPLAFYQYWHQYGEQKHVQKWLAIAAAGAAFIVFAPGVLFFAPAKRSLFGDARFASRSEVAKAGLLGEKGLIVGRYGNKYLTFPGQQHAIISAPTRSGKGVGVVIPNLLAWPDSVVVLDIKQENWAITSKFRAKHGQACYLFNPGSKEYRTHRYNPLAYLDPNPVFRIDDVQKIGAMLFPDQPGTDVIWTATPRSLFTGIVLYLCETPGKLVTMGQVLRESLADGDGAEYFQKIIAERQARGNPLSVACVNALNTYASITAENTRSGIIGGFRSRLELWSNPLVDAATSANDFDLRQVRKRRMSIYIGLTPDNLDRMQPLLNLMFQQLVDLNTRELPEQDKSIKHTCLLLWDEFTAAGKVPILAKGISYIAGYWLRMMPIIQSPAQLVEVYGEAAAETFQTNHALQIVFPPKASELKTARDISEWLGYQTVKGKSESKSKNPLAKRDATQSTSDQRRALLLPQEITGLGKEKELVVLEDVPPILAKKVRYFNDPTFIDRLKSVSPKLKALGGKLPSKKQLDAAIESGELAAPIPLIDVEGFMADMAIKAPAVPAPKFKGAEGRTVVTQRAVTATDVPGLAARALADFAIDFGGLDAPKADPTGELDIDALNKYADAMCARAGISV